MLLDYLSLSFTRTHTVIIQERVSEQKRWALPPRAPVNPPELRDWPDLCLSSACVCVCLHECVMCADAPAQSCPTKHSPGNPISALSQPQPRILKVFFFCIPVKPPTLYLAASRQNCWTQFLFLASTPLITLVLFHFWQSCSYIQLFWPTCQILWSFCATCINGVLLLNRLSKEKKRNNLYHTDLPVLKCRTDLCCI